MQTRFDFTMSEEENEPEVQSMGEWAERPAAGAIKLERVEAGRTEGGFTLHRDGRAYHRRRNRHADQSPVYFVQTYRCSKHSKGCLVKIRVNGCDEVITGDLDKLSQHTCEKDPGRCWKLKIYAELRKGMDGAVEEGRVAKFNWEVVSAMRKFTKGEQKLAKMSFHDAKSFCYERARKGYDKRTPIPKDRLDWHFDASSDKLFRRDPSHSFYGFGEPADAGFKLLDQNFEFKDTKSGQARLGKVVIFGDGKMLERWAPKFLGCVVDGSSYCASPPFDQLLSLAFQLPVEWGGDGEVTKVSHIVGLHVLMSHSVKEAYVVIWRWLKDFLTGLRLEYIMADSDVEACADFLEVFGPAMRQRCTYNFGRTLRGHLVQKKVFGTLVGADTGTYRSWLRFLASLMYFKTQHVRPVYRRFRQQVIKYRGRHSEIFSQHLLPCLERLYIGVPLPDGRWTEPCLPFASFSRHQDVLLGYVQDGKAFEPLHSVLNKAAGPRSGVYALAECLYYVLEMTTARLRQLELIRGDERSIREDKELDTSVTERDFVQFMGGDYRPEADRPLIEKLTGQHGGSTGAADRDAFTHYVHKDTLGFVKKNPLARDFIKERVGKVESVTGQGYLTMEEAGRDLHLGFPSLDCALRCYAFYEWRGEAYLYLWGRKVAQLVDHFGTASPFEMSQRERKALLSNAYDPVLFHFEVRSDEAEGRESDVEDALKEAQKEYTRQASRQDQVQKAAQKTITKVHKIQDRERTRSSLERGTKVPGKGEKTRKYHKSSSGGTIRSQRDHPVDERASIYQSVMSAKSQVLAAADHSQVSARDKLLHTSAKVVTEDGVEAGDSSACERVSLRNSASAKRQVDAEQVQQTCDEASSNLSQQCDQWSELDSELGQLESRRAKVEEAAAPGDAMLGHNAGRLHEAAEESSVSRDEVEAGRDLPYLLDETDEEEEDADADAFESAEEKSSILSHHESSDIGFSEAFGLDSCPNAEKHKDDIEVADSKPQNAAQAGSFLPLDSGDPAIDMSLSESKPLGNFHKRLSDTSEAIDPDDNMSPSKAKRQKTEAKSTIPCPQCGAEVKAEELELHIRRELGYYPISCTLCAAEFLDWDKAEAHFGGRFSRHRGLAPKLTEERDAGKEQRLEELLAQAEL